MSPQSEGETVDVSRIRVLDTRGVLFHNAHVKSGARFKQGCGLCPLDVEEDAGILTFEVPDRGVRKGGGVDPEEATPSASGLTSWEQLIDGGRVRNAGEVQ